MHCKFLPVAAELFLACLAFCMIITFTLLYKVVKYGRSCDVIGWVGFAAYFPRAIFGFGDDPTLAVNRCVVFSLFRCKHCFALSQITTQLSPPANILALCGVTFSAHTREISSCTLKKHFHSEHSVYVTACFIILHIVITSQLLSSCTAAALAAKLTIHR